MKRKTSKFSISKARRRAILVASIALGVTVGGFGIKTALDAKGDASAVIVDNYRLVASKLVINPLYEEYLRDVESGDTEKWDVIPNMYVLDSDTETPNGIIYGDPEINEQFPTRYDLREDGYATPKKNQGNDGICWAFATTTAMESYLKKNLGKDLDIEFSPKQMDYVMAPQTPYEKTVTRLYGDLPNYQLKELGEGSNFSYAGIAFGGMGVSPVDEASFFNIMKSEDVELETFNSWLDYENTNILKALVFNAERNAYTKNLSYDKVTSVNSEYVANGYTEHYLNNNIIEQVKDHILEDGAVYVGTVSPQVSGCWDDASNTIIDRGHLTCDQAANGGHAMAIVGWDDNYSYTNPSNGRAEQGAFILQNSWGPANLFGKYNITDTASLISVMGIDTSSYSEQELEEMTAFWDNYIANYAATNTENETIYLAYNFSKGQANDANQTVFGFIDNMEENNYSDIYGLASENYKGSKLIDDDASYNGLLYGKVFEYDTEDETRYIDSIGVLAFALYDSSDLMKYKLAISNDGKKYIELGDVEFETFSSGQKILKLTQPIEVTGNFYVKYDSYAVDTDTLEEYISLIANDINRDGDIDDENENWSNYLQMTVFLKDEAENSVELDKLLRGTKEITWNSTTKEKYTIGDGKDLVFSIDYDYNYFDSIKVDNKALESKNYKVESGSTKITIFHDYLDTLTAGKHSIKVAFKDGESVDLEFNVAAQTNTGGGNQGGGTGTQGGNDGGSDGGDQGGGTGTQGGNDDGGQGIVADAPSTSSSAESRSTGTSNTGRFTAEAQERAELTIIFTLPVVVVLFGLFRFGKLKKRS